MRRSQTPSEPDHQPPDVLNQPGDDQSTPRPSSITYQGEIIRLFASNRPRAYSEDPLNSFLASRLLTDH
jgi:hypothetical protein